MNTPGIEGNAWPVLFSLGTECHFQTMPCRCHHCHFLQDKVLASQWAEGRPDFAKTLDCQGIRKIRFSLPVYIWNCQVLGYYSFFFMIIYGLVPGVAKSPHLLEIPLSLSPCLPSFFEVGFSCFQQHLFSPLLFFLLFSSSGPYRGVPCVFFTPLYTPSCQFHPFLCQFCINGSHVDFSKASFFSPDIEPHT